MTWTCSVQTGGMAAEPLGVLRRLFKQMERLGSRDDPSASIVGHSARGALSVQEGRGRGTRQGTETTGDAEGGALGAPSPGRELCSCLEGSLHSSTPGAGS